MSSSWTQNFYHAVFGTKRRELFITGEFEPRLHAFLGGIARDLGCAPVAINGMAEHVHVLVRYPSDLSHSDLVRHLKSRSSKWVHETFSGLSDFGWQEGYGGFTVSKPNVEDVAAYIRDQKTHHNGRTFEQEYLEMLRRTGWEGDVREVLP